MAGKIKYGKILVVIVITVLIWVWADLAQDEELEVSGAKIILHKSIDPSLWVSFDDESSVSIDSIMLKGPALKVADVERKLRARLLVPEFFLDAAQEEALTVPGKHSLDIENFLRKTEKIKKQFGLTVESCEPDRLTIKVVELVKTPLDVECFDENGIPLKAETIEPSRVDMFVPEDWVGRAKVQLTRSERIQARGAPVTKNAYIELVPGWTIEAQDAVKITLVSEEKKLLEYDIPSAIVGYVFSPVLQGKYKVELTNLNAVMGAIAIRATPEAKQAYENKTYQVILKLRDSDRDAKSAEPLRRELIYNFPQEYIRSNEIRLDQPPVEARFKLIPLPSAGAQ